MKAETLERPKNLNAILDWCKRKRPDCTAQIETMAKMNGSQGDAFILLMTIGFEAGREFQKDNPKLPFGGGAY